MNILVVVPRIVNKIGDWYPFPLGIAYISASLKQQGFPVFTLNLNSVEGTVPDLLQAAIEAHGIGLVATGGLTGQYGSIREILETAKRIRPSLITVCGGGMITSAPEHAMEALAWADYGVIGEGELICNSLCSCLAAGKDIRHVAGVVYRDGTRFRQTSGTPAPVDLAGLPFPDYEGLGFADLSQSVPNIWGLCEYNTLPIVTSRSCPHHCTFCFHPSGQKYRERSLDSVFAEIDILKTRYGVKYLSIQDELFGHNKTRVREFCRRIQPYGIQWMAQFRVTDLSPEIVRHLKDAHCIVVGLGIESADNRVLRSMRKGITIEQSEKALQLVYEAGIGIQGVLIFGDVAETRKTAARTFDWWKEHIQYELQLSMVKAYPGSAIYEHACRKGIVTDPVQYIRDACPLVNLSGMSAEDYAWILEQVGRQPLLMYRPPSDVTVQRIDYAAATMDIAGNCVSCGSPNTWHGTKLFVLEPIACQHCRRRHVAPIPNAVADRISTNFDRLLDRFGRVAIWGVNSYYYALSEKLNRNPRYRDTANIVYVDKSELRHGIDVAGHRIHSTDVLRERAVPCVVVPMTNFVAALRKPIQDEYPGVEVVLSISDLLLEDVTGLC
ncbi:MAG: radical SAM protein [Lentisphaeria bacterium]|nr:radical SAM protein [Lentisphaeria bacterium]